MDVISFSEAATANSRIEIINANPDSSSGIVTVPKTIASGETITIPAGRVAVLPNVQIDGVLNVEGEVFIPSGATFGDLETQLALKAPLSSPAFTGSPIAPTQTAQDNSTKVATTAYVDGKMVRGTAVTASGTSIDFTGIQSWAKRITVMLNGVSTNGTSPVIIQLGSGAIQTTGYSSSACLSINAGASIGTLSVTGMTTAGGSSESTRNITASIYSFSSNIYTCSMSGAYTDGGTGMSSGGIVTLAGVLDRIRITTANGTGTFDSGSVNIMYEG